MNKKDKILNIVLPLFSVACIFVLWAVGSALSGDKAIYPSVGQTLSEFFTLFSYGEFYLALLSTLVRSLIAFAVSFALAFALALLSNKNKNAQRIIAPIVAIIRTLPTVAVVLLILFWSSSSIAPVIVTMLVVFPTMFTNVKTCLGSVDKDVLEMCNAFGVDKKCVFKKVYLPQIAPELLGCIGSGIGLNIKLMVAAEVLAHTANCIGYYLNVSAYYDEVSKMLAIVIATVIVGLLIEGLFTLLSKKVGEWQ